MFQLNNSGNGRQVAPGRQFKVFEVLCVGVGPEPVRGSVVAVTDHIETLVGGKERSLLGDPGSVISFQIGFEVVTGCGSRSGAADSGPV